MSDAAGLIAALDQALVIAGEKITLRRSFGAQTKEYVSVDAMAAVRLPTSAEIVGTVQENDLFCVMSPSEIDRAQWPGGYIKRDDQDLRIPSKTLGDQVHIRGKWCSVEWAQGFYPGGELCRVEIRVRG